MHTRKPRRRWQLWLPSSENLTNDCLLAIFPGWQSLVVAGLVRFFSAFGCFLFGGLSVSGSSVPLGAEPISISRRSPTAPCCFDVQYFWRSCWRRLLMSKRPTSQRWERLFVRLGIVVTPTVIDRCYAFCTGEGLAIPAYPSLPVHACDSLPCILLPSAHYHAVA